MTLMHRHRFTGYYHQLRISLYRPSPQVPQPSAQAARICFESSSFVLDLSHKQIESGTMSVTWVFLLTLNAALNALLWATSYPEVRLAHSRDEVEKLVNLSLLSFDRCAERWPGTAYTSQLYGIFAKACLQSYELGGADSQRPVFSLASPPSGAEAQLSPGNTQQQQMPYPMNPPQFGFVFDSPAESMNSYAFDPSFPPPHPTFRSNSIFCNPASESSGRRFSYFPPDFNQSGEGGLEDTGASTTSPDHTLTSPSDQNSNQLPTPPESLPTGGLSTATPSTSFSPTGVPPCSNMSDTSADAGPLSARLNPSPPPQKFMPSHTPQLSFTTSRPTQPDTQQRPLPTTTSPVDWFSPPAPFISPYNFGPMSGSFFNDAMPNNFADTAPTGLGLQNVGMDLNAAGPFSFTSSSSPSSLIPAGRQGSLTQEQQLELMNVLETEGAGDIDNFLNASNNMVDVTWY